MALAGQMDLLAQIDSVFVERRGKVNQRIADED